MLPTSSIRAAGRWALAFALCVMPLWPAAPRLAAAAPSAPALAAPALEACVASLGPALCAAPGVGGDWRALAAAGTPPQALAKAISRCAPQKGGAGPAQERQAYSCARAALWGAARAVRIKHDPATLTGRYIARSPGFFGELTILEPPEGPVRLRLRAERTAPGRAAANTCRLELDAAWRTRREIAWKGALVAGAPQSICDIAARPTGDGVVVESAARCDWACGAGVDYQAMFRLER